MLIPSMYDLPTVMVQSGFMEESVFDLGISGAIIFLVVVPEIGACRVPDVALSHFMAGADEYAAEGMKEHYSGALSGRWTVKRNRLRIQADSWEKYTNDCLDLVDALTKANHDEAKKVDWKTHVAGEAKAWLEGGELGREAYRKAVIAQAEEKARQQVRTVSLPIAPAVAPVSPSEILIEPNKDNKPLSKAAAQDAEILNVIRKLGYEPQKLSKNLPGKKGVKAEVRRAVGKKGMWVGTTVFNKAWERLTANKDIKIYD